MLKLKNKKIILIICLIPVYLFSYYISLVPINYSFTSPGGIQKVDKKIKIDNDFEISGGFYTTFVLSPNRISPLVKYYGSLSNFNDVYELSESSSLLSNKELSTFQKLSFQQGIDDSLIASFEAANKEITYLNQGATVYFVFKDIANTNLEIGDVVVNVNGNQISNASEISGFLTDSGEQEFILVDGTKKTANIVNYQNRNIIGVNFINNVLITDSEIEYEILQKSGNGGSGGLMNSLELYSNLIQKDLTYGKKIAGTGTIDRNGIVGPIGGISQKIVTAIMNDVDLFFTPKEHYNEALEVYQNFKTDMILVEVGTLNEAIEYLEGEFNAKQA